MNTIGPYIFIFSIVVSAIIVVTIFILTLYRCFCDVSEIYSTRYLSINDHETHGIPMLELVGSNVRGNREMGEHL